MKQGLKNCAKGLQRIMSYAEKKECHHRDGAA